MVSMYVDPDRFEQSVHAELACSECHTNMMGERTTAPKPLPANVMADVAKYRTGTRPAAASCAGCHPNEWGAYRDSIHAKAHREGKRDAPFCSDCHGSHYILGTADLESRINPTNVPNTCASCHSVGLLMARYNVETDTYQTFQQSVHGRKVLLGARGAAVCTSCHGVHNIRSPKDPDSPLSPTHRADTCRECHKGASDKFALTFKHVTPSPTEDPVIYYVRLAYIIAISLMIGMMAGYVLLDLLRRTIEWARKRGECE